MRLNEIVEKLNLRVVCDGGDLDREIAGGYASDLMSDAIAHAEPGDIWVTLQVHMHVVAIASMKDVSAILLTENRSPNEDTLETAREEAIPIVTSELGAFEVIGQLHDLGIRGK